MLEVFNNAKVGTVLAFSWPPIHLISNMKANFKFNEPHVNYCPAGEELSYITPAQHADLMSYIVKTDKPNLRSKLENSLAVSLSVDGSVARFQLDNKHVTCKIMTDDGKQENLLLGFDEAPERRTTGYVAAVKSAVEWVIPWDSLFLIVSSIVTDGANENTGDYNSLWARPEQERVQGNREMPLLKIWCGVHRADLAFSSVSSSVSEVNTIIKDASALSTFFHTSAVRTKALQQIGERNGFVVKRLPSYFEARWTEFTYRLLFNILSSWKAIVSYLQTSDDSAAKGHLRNWTDLCKLKTVCLVADLLMVFSRFKKSLQDNAINVFDIESKVTSVKKRISKFKASPLLGGWEECLEKDLSVKNKFHGIQLIGRQRRNERHHALVSDRRDFKAIRNETITSLSNFIEQRYKSHQSGKPQQAQAFKEA